MSLKLILGFAPVKYSVLGPSAESLSISYNLPGLTFRIADKRKQHGSITTLSNDTISFSTNAAVRTDVLSQQDVHLTVPGKETTSIENLIPVNSIENRVIQPCSKLVNLTIADKFSLEIEDA